MTEEEEKRALKALDGISQGLSYSHLVREGILKDPSEPARWAMIDKSFRVSLRTAEKICANVIVNGVLDHVDSVEIAKRFKLASVYDPEKYGSQQKQEEPEAKQTAKELDMKKQELLFEVQDILSRAKKKQAVIDG